MRAIYLPQIVIAQPTLLRLVQWGLVWSVSCCTFRLHCVDKQQAEPSTLLFLHSGTCARTARACERVFSSESSARRLAGVLSAARRLCFSSAATLILELFPWVICVNEEGFLLLFRSLAVSFGAYIIGDGGSGGGS